MKKNILVLISVFLYCFLAISQEDTLYIYKDGDITHTIATSDIDSITFYTVVIPLEDSVTDIDGNKYGTITINNQVWMTDNLKVTRYADGSPIPKVTGYSNWSALTATDEAYCYYNDDSATYAETYGALYSWAAAMKGASTSSANPSGIQGACPNGWHLPSDEEIKELEMALGMTQVDADNTGFRGPGIGAKMAGKETLWDDDVIDTHADFGTSGLNIIPSGYRSQSGSFNHVGVICYFWSATEETVTDAWRRGLGNNHASSVRDSEVKESAYVIRCVKD